MRQAKLQGQRSIQGQQASCRGGPTTGPGLGDKTTDTILRLHVSNVAQGPTSSGRNAGPSTKNGTIVGDLDIFGRCADKIHTVEAARLSSTT